MSVVLSPDPAGFGALLTTDWSGLSGPFTDTDWTPLFPVVDPSDPGDPHNYVAWCYAGTGTQSPGPPTPGAAGSLSTLNAPIAAGYYRVSYNEAGGYTVKERSNAISVVSAGNLVLPSYCLPGATIDVNWDSFFPGSQTNEDWLPLYTDPSYFGSSSFVDWNYAGSGGKAPGAMPGNPGSIPYTMPVTEGDYWMSYNSHGTYAVMAGSNKITVTSTPPPSSSGAGFFGMCAKAWRERSGILVPELWLPGSARDRPLLPMPDYAA